MDDYSPTGLGTCTTRVGLTSGLQYAWTPCVLQRLSKTRTHSCTRALSCTGPTSAYPHHYGDKEHRSGISFLGHPTPPRLAAWSPSPASPERAPGGLLRSVCPFSATLGRMLYAVPLVSNGYHIQLDYVAEWGHFPFWACLLSVRRQTSTRFGRFQLTTLCPHLRLRCP